MDFRGPAKCCWLSGYQHTHSERCAGLREISVEDEKGLGIIPLVSTRCLLCSLFLVSDAFGWLSVSICHKSLRKKHVLLSV